jgi:hypothetical protein
MMLMLLPQRGHASTSIMNTRLISSAQGRTLRLFPLAV